MTLNINPPKLKDVTTNPLYPAYKTEKGTTIQLNSKRTLLPKGKTLWALVKFVDASGLNTVVITGGAEATGHSQGSFHGKNLAIDVAGLKFNKLTHEKAKDAALKAGFTHGVYEDFRGSNRDHWHFQIGVGNGLTDTHALSNSKLYIKKY